MKKIIAGALIVAIAGATAVFLIAGKKSDDGKYTTEKVARRYIRSTVLATGTVNPVTTVLVGTQVSGTIKYLYVDYNSFVKKGQLLAQIDPSNFEAQVDQSRANLLLAEANVKKAEAALLEAKRALERNRMLFSRDLIARSDLDTAETNEISARAQLEAAKAQVEQSRAALKIAETNLKFTRIASPVDGMVISRNVDVGQTVAASFQTPTLFNIAEDLSRMQIETSVDEADIGRIRAGQTVEFSVDAYPDKNFRGTVSLIRNAPITVQNVVTYTVIVAIHNPGLILKPGMTANVTIITAEKKGVLSIPNSALRFRLVEKDPGTAGRKETGVWVWDRGAARRVIIDPGISNGSYTEISAGGLSEGDEVILYSADGKSERAAFPRRWWFR